MCGCPKYNMITSFNITTSHFFDFFLRSGNGNSQASTNSPTFPHVMAPSHSFCWQWGLFLTERGCPVPVMTVSIAIMFQGRRQCFQHLEVEQFLIVWWNLILWYKIVGSVSPTGIELNGFNISPKLYVIWS